MSLFSIIVDIGARTADIESGISRVESKLTHFGDTVQHIGEIVTAGAFGEFAKKLIDMADDIDNASKKAALSVTAFQQLAYAAKQSGVNSSDLASAVVRMNKALSDASTGAAQPTAALRALGLTFSDLAKLDPDQQLEVLADRISKLASPADKARAEIELFGKEGAALGPLFSQGADGIIKLRGEAERLGAVMSEDTVKNLEEAHKSIDRLESSFSTLAATLLGKVAPSLTGVIDSIEAVVTGDPIMKLKSDIDFLNRMSQESGYLSTGGNKNLGGAGFHSSDDARKRAQELTAQLGVQQTSQSFNASSFTNADMQSLFAGTSPGFAATRPIDLTFKPDLTKLDSGAMDKLLDQWKEETQSIQEGVETTYDLTILKLKELLNAGIIDPEEFKKRADVAVARYQEVFEQLQPVRVSAKKIINLTDAERDIDQFTDDVKGALDQTAHESGKFGDNLLRNILNALENRAIYEAIENIGAFLASTLRAASQSGGSGLGSIIGSLFGASGGGGGSGASLSAGTPDYSSIPGFATGGSFNVGGFGGTDSQLVAFRATPGENVSVGGGGGAGVTIHNHIDARGADADRIMRIMPTLLAQTAEKSKRDILDAFQRRGIPAPRHA